LKQPHEFGVPQSSPVYPESQTHPVLVQVPLLEQSFLQMSQLAVPLYVCPEASKSWLRIHSFVGGSPIVNSGSPETQTSQTQSLKEGEVGLPYFAQARFA